MSTEYDKTKGLATLDAYVADMNANGSFNAEVLHNEEGVKLALRPKNSYKTILEIRIAAIPSESLAFDMTQLAAAAANAKLSEKKGGEA